MNRRQFVCSAAIGILPASASRNPVSRRNRVSEGAAASPTPWYRTAYRRNVIDMHITDWNPEFLSQFDPRTYVELLKLAQVQSAVVYAHSHVGLCYFPTKVGRTHKAYEGKDYLRQVVDGCHKNGIGVVLYFSAIFDRWAYENHAAFRMRTSGGAEAAQGSRHGLCCPNSPYRDYAVSLTEEIGRGYDFEGIRFDMVFWPGICYCSYCQKRFRDEVGGDLPKVINWEDPRWVAFQRKREQWLVEFAALLKSTVRKLKPAATVEHQASTYASPWRLGVTAKLAEQNDFLQGDFYGDALQGSFARKLFYNLSPNLPYGFETSVMAHITNHTAIKSKELLTAKAFASLADAGAFVFIDAVDPVGTLNRTVYETMNEVFRQTMPYQKYLGGTLCQDVAIYLSTESKCDFADNGKGVDGPGLSGRMPHVDAAVSVCKSLIDHHIPFGVITKKSLAHLKRHVVLVLPNVLMMDAEEVAAIRDYVRGGGKVYASKYTSLVTKDGKRQNDFLLADVFGTTYVGQTKEHYTYMATSTQKPGFSEKPGFFSTLFAPYTVKQPIGLDSAQLIVKAKPQASVLAKLVLPYTEPTDPGRYASIHSNPPGKTTDHPAIVLNKFGKGKAIYVAGELEASEFFRDVFVRLIRLLHSDFSFEADGPRSVEVTLFHQADKRRYLVNLVNFQKELPNIPVTEMRVRVRLNGKRVRRLLVLPNEQALAYETRGDLVEFRPPRLETFQMVAVDYE